MKIKYKSAFNGKSIKAQALVYRKKGSEKYPVIHGVELLRVFQNVINNLENKLHPKTKTRLQTFSKNVNIHSTTDFIKLANTIKIRNKNSLELRITFKNNKDIYASIKGKEGLCNKAGYTDTYIIMAQRLTDISNKRTKNAPKSDNGPYYDHLVAQDILAIVQGKEPRYYPEQTQLLFETALLLFAVEPARDNASLGTAFLALDMVAKKCMYGQTNQEYALTDDKGKRIGTSKRKPFLWRNVLDSAKLYSTGWYIKNSKGLPSRRSKDNPIPELNPHGKSKGYELSSYPRPQFQPPVTKIKGKWVTLKDEIYIPKTNKYSATKLESGKLSTSSSASVELETHNLRNINHHIEYGKTVFNREEQITNAGIYASRKNILGNLEEDIHILMSQVVDNRVMLKEISLIVHWLEEEILALLLDRSQTGYHIITATKEDILRIFEKALQNILEVFYINNEYQLELQNIASILRYEQEFELDYLYMHDGKLFEKAALKKGLGIQEEILANYDIFKTRQKHTELLYQAIRENNVDEFSKHIKKSLNVNYHGDEERNTALHLAVKNGNVDMAKQLLRKGARINAQNHVGETPLHIAVRSKNLELVKLLIDYGAQIDRMNLEYKSPLNLISKDFEENSSDEITREIHQLFQTAKEQIRRDKLQKAANQSYMEREEIARLLIDNRKSNGYVYKILDGVTPSMDDIYGENTLLSALHEINKTESNDIVVIPINVNSNHWTTLVYDGRYKMAYYFNSKREDDSGIDIQRQVETILGNEVTFFNLMPEVEFQKDGEACGTWVAKMTNKIVSILSSDNYQKYMSEAKKEMRSVESEEVKNQIIEKIYVAFLNKLQDEMKDVDSEVVLKEHYENLINLREKLYAEHLVNNEINFSNLINLMKRLGHIKPRYMEDLESINLRGSKAEPIKVVTKSKKRKRSSAGYVKKFQKKRRITLDSQLSKKDISENNSDSSNMDVDPIGSDLAFDNDLFGELVEVSAENYLKDITLNTLINEIIDKLINCEKGKEEDLLNQIIYDLEKNKQFHSGDVVKSISEEIITKIKIKYEKDEIFQNEMCDYVDIGIIWAKRYKAAENLKHIQEIVNKLKITSKDELEKSFLEITKRIQSGKIIVDNEIIDELCDKIVVLIEDTELEFGYDVEVAIKEAFFNKTYKL